MAPLVPIQKTKQKQDIRRYSLSPYCIANFVGQIFLGEAERTWSSLGDPHDLLRLQLI